MHYIQAFVTTQQVDLKAAQELGMDIIEEDQATLIPLFEDHTLEWTEKLGIDDSAFIQKVKADPAMERLGYETDGLAVDDLVLLLDHPTIMEFARRLGLTDFALVYTLYFGGAGGQFAICYQDGIRTLPPTSDGISKALRMIGISKGDCHDEFEAAGLMYHRSFGPESKGAAERQREWELEQQKKPKKQTWFQRLLGNG